MKMQFDPNSTGDHRGIMRGSQHVGAAVRFATGQWGAAGMDGKPRTRELFDTPEAVRTWFEGGEVMAKLAFDMSRCSNATCDVRETCLRFTDPGHPTYQAYSHFEGGENCGYRIPDHEKKDA